MEQITRGADRESLHHGQDRVIPSTSVLLAWGRAGGDDGLLAGTGRVSGCLLTKHNPYHARNVLGSYMVSLLDLSWHGAGCDLWM